MVLKALGLFVLIVVLVLGIPYVATSLGFIPGNSARIFEAVLSWPVAVTTLGVFLLLRFREPISDLIRYGRWRFGNWEIQGQSPREPNGNEPEKYGEASVTPDQQRALEKYILELRDKQVSAQVEVDQLRESLQNAYFQATVWEFKYEACFFVPSTKQVLYWFALGAPQPRSAYDAVWAISIPDRQQRDITLEVLQQFVMLEDRAGLLQVTPKGIAFLQFIGMIPYPPSSDSSKDS